MNNADSPQAGLPHRTVGRCPHIRVPRDRSARVERCSSKRSLAKGSRWNEQCCIKKLPWRNKLKQHSCKFGAYYISHACACVWAVRCAKPWRATNSCELSSWLVAHFARGVEPSCWANGTAAFGSWDGADVLCCAWHVQWFRWTCLTVLLCWNRFRSYLPQLRPTDPLIITIASIFINRHCLIAAWLSSLCKLWIEVGMTKQCKGTNLLRGIYLQYMLWYAML